MTAKNKIRLVAGCVIIALSIFGCADVDKLRAESFETVKEAEEHVFNVEPNITIGDQKKSVIRQNKASIEQMPIRKPTQRPYPDFDLKNLSIIGQEGQINDSSRVKSAGESAEDNGGGEGSESVDEGFNESGSGSESVDDSDSRYSVEVEGSADEADPLDGGGYEEETSDETELSASVDEYGNTDNGEVAGSSEEYDDGGDSGSSESAWSEEGGLTCLGVWTTTAYCPCEICCGVWATGCTASGVLATPNHTVACGSLPFGTQVMIDGTIYTVEDTGVEGEWIDIFFSSHEEALAYGMQMKEVYLIG